MKHKLLLVLLTALIPCLFMQGCISNSEEDNTELSEEDRVAEMFREAGFKVEKLSKPANSPMTEKEALLFLEAYKNRERSGSVQISGDNIEQKSDGSFAIKIKCNSDQKNFSRTRASDNEEFNFTHRTDYVYREIYVECYRDHGGYWHSQNVQCNPIPSGDGYSCHILSIDPDTGLSTVSLSFRICVTVSRYSAWFVHSFDEKYDYVLTLWSQSSGGWAGTLNWTETYL